ncbi:MAG: bifunctional methylenetetrahydrofolate dehydrogenase/methenyltetrahydrofolate cyclohydrolase FolD [Lentisphaeria bacterium]|nr:bifunctional methylenetetrahydrofolate dehydrogenase/methenyltetrahydrofolate cyclohydrolase FolD [Lentisphaeria bacterium]NQZ69976.1 bifunctional methylenetetrahydrofolate dehydrogenase/methenyltetrahydrofolate cyclohydrolase FolD [Lentisphaeria bacterium]
MILSGKEVSAAVYSRIESQIASLSEKHSVTPGLAVVLVGEDPASQSYVNSKAKKCEKLGIYSEKHVLDTDTSQADVLALIDTLNNKPEINGILVQSPQPPQIDERAIIDAINPQKDVDCFHPVNVGKMLIGDEDGFVPCTPAGVMEILAHYEIETQGKHAVVLGRSNIVGKPMCALLSRKGKYANCTVTMCHSRTQNLNEICLQADIIIAATGIPEMVRGDMVKDDVVIIDVGINRVDDASDKRGYRLVGDVAFDEVEPKASAITPVPGGVGPMTIAMLLQNTIRAACQQNSIALESL